MASDIFRIIGLPTEVGAAKVTATVKNGVLNITAPKLPRQKPFTRSQRLRKGDPREVWADAFDRIGPTFPSVGVRDGAKGLFALRYLGVGALYRH